MTSTGGSSGGSSGSSGSTADRNRVTPRSQSSAPKGAFLGTTSSGASLVANGQGDGTINGPKAPDNMGRSDGDTVKLMAPLTFPAPAYSISDSNGGGDSPSGLAPGKPADAIDTTVSGGGNDVMTALASVVGQAASRPPAISNNFTSLASRAGSKRSLIGGA